VSQGAHTAADGDPPLPASAGVAGGVKLLVLLGLLAAVMQGAFVVASAGFGRVWPAADSGKVPLPPATLK